MSSGRAQATGEPLDLGNELLGLLRLGRYEELADLIRREADETGHTVTGRILDVARSICRACSQDQLEVARHNEALVHIARRERVLNRGVETLLDLLGVQTVAGARASGRRGSGTAPSRRPTTVPQRVEKTRRGRRSVRDREPARLRARSEDPNPGLHEQAQAGRISPAMAVHCLGPFEVYYDDVLIESWPNGKGKAIFKYLVTRRERTVGKEILMELLWPHAKPHAARNNLNVAIYSLRQAFARVSRSCSVVLFQNDSYVLNPDVELWLDYEALEQHLAAAQALEQQGELALAIDKYRCADALYRGEFLEEDRYEDWPHPLRRSLANDYLGLLDRLSEHYLRSGEYGDCAVLCRKILTVDACYEEAHRRLMRCWSKQGLPHLAVREYQVCGDALSRELDLQPSRETTELFNQVRQRQPL
jgi:DNA-binding SARP family transcriptional activator